MSRSSPNILLTGTPGVGKSKFAEILNAKLGLEVINVGQFARENNCLGDWDSEYESHELKEDELLDLLEEKLGKGDGGIIVEHHVPELFPERWFDLVLVLRCSNTLLYDRLQSRQYSGRKLEENLQAEIFQTILDEAKESYREELVVELLSEKEEDVESNRARVEAWIVQWRDQRNTVRPTKRKATAELPN